MKEGLGGLNARLGIFPEAAVSADPGKEALYNNPPLWMHGKADLILRLVDDLDLDQR